MRSAWGMLVLVLFTLSSCAPNSVARLLMGKTKPKTNFTFTENNSPLDYYNLKNWLSLPDSLDTYPVDVFFVHPTTYISNKSWNMPKDDSNSINWTINVPLITEASVFDNFANIYVPKYQQATLYSFLDDQGNGEKALKVAYQDVKNAFYHYLEYYNSGKPFFIAGHSQGSFHILHLIEEILLDENISDKLITAYAIGWPVYESYLLSNPYVEVCEDSLATGCIVSWNTEERGALYSLVKEPAVSVNPLSWETNEKYMSKDYHMGSKFYHYDGIIEIENYIGAKNKNGVLIIDHPYGKQELDMPFKAGNYHVYDYSFFYKDIQNNINQRIKSYYKKHAPLAKSN